MYERRSNHFSLERNKKVSTLKQKIKSLKLGRDDSEIWKEAEEI